MADGEQLSDFLTSQNIALSLRPAISGHNNTLSAKQKSNQANNSVERKLATGSNTSDNNSFDEPWQARVGGVCLEDDGEDEGLKTIDCTAGVNHIPRLVFLGSEEDLSKTFNGENDTENKDENFDRNFRRSESESNGDGFIDIYRTDRNDRSGSNTKTDSNQRRENNLIGSSQYSLNNSIDSELLADHISEDNSEDIERFIMENEMTDDSLSKLLKWHCHDPNTFLLPDRMARNQLITVSVLCFLFMVGEAIGRFVEGPTITSPYLPYFICWRWVALLCHTGQGGALSNSLALFTDVLHLGSDLISFLISLLAIYLARKPATKKMSFGYHRAEVLGALFSVFIIWSVTGILVYMAVERIVHGHYKEVKPDEMLITASLGVIFNLVMGFVLHSEVCCRSKRRSFGHNHSHGSSSHNSHHSDRSHSHNNSAHLQIADDSEVPLLEDSIEEGGEEGAPKGPHLPHHKNINVRAAFIHVIGDIIQSLGVLIAALIIKLKPEEKYRLADPICTFLFSVLVLFTTINVLRDTLHVIMEGVPRDIDYHSIKDCLQNIKGVKAVHGLTVWCLTLEKNALAVHLAADPLVNHKMVLLDASEALRRRFDFVTTTIQVEDYKSDIMSSCNDCVGLHK